MSIFPQGTFIFDPSKGETPQTIARKREIADRIMYGRRRSPQNIGEGIAALGEGIVAGVLNRRANKAEEVGQQGANALKENIIAAMMGGDNLPFPPAPGGDQPQNYASQGAAQVHTPTGERAGYIRQGLLQRGLPEHVADAFLMNFQDESGLDPGINERNPIVPGSRGGFGLYQLTGPRRRAYEQFANQRGVNPSDIDAQLDFMMTELQGPESRAARSIFDAQDTGTAAAAIVNQFLRPAEAHRARRVARYTSGGQSQPTSLSNALVSPNVPMVGGMSNADTSAMQAHMGGVPVAETKADILAQEAAMAAKDPHAFQQPGLPFQQSAAPTQGAVPPMSSPQMVSDMPVAGTQSASSLSNYNINPDIPMAGAVGNNTPPPSGPSMQLLVQAASNPFLMQNEGMRAVVMAQLQQQMQNQDPMRQMQMRALEQQVGRGQSLVNAGGGQLYDPNTGHWITAPGSDQPAGPAAFQTLELRARAAGLEPGTPEYQQFMASGGKSENETAATQRIDRMTENLMATGDFIDPQEAQNVAAGIVDGRLKADRHPVTGELQVVDMATGRPVYGGRQQQNPTQPGMLRSPAVPMSSHDQFGQQFPAANEAFGVPGALAGGINRVSDALGVGPVYPEIQQTQADFGVLRESLLNDMSGAYGRQPPSWLLKEIRDLTPAAGSPFEGASGAQSKLNAIGRHLTSELSATDQALQRELSPQNRQDLEARRAGLQMGIDRVTGALRSFGGIVSLGVV